MVGRAHPTYINLKIATSPKTEEGNKMTRKYLLVMLAMLALIPMLAYAAQAAPVGRFTKVEGQVDLLKGGKLPAVAAKVQDPVEPGDVIRTKSKSRAQVQFVDDTILTLAPESRVAVADYLYDGARGQRRALLQVFRGLVHTVVKQVLKLQEPDFIMQTQTAVIGVRGTEWYGLNLPNCSYVYNIHGLLELSSSNRQIVGDFPLHTLKYREVCRDQVPGPEQDVTPAMLAMLQRMMLTGVTEAPLGFPGAEGPPPGMERRGLPEGATPPYAPPLTPAPILKTPGSTYP